MRILLIRHGDPYYPTDSLTEKGQREAEALSLRLKDEGISEVYVSPLGRARLTAVPTLEKTGLSAVTLDWLREFPSMLADEKTYNTDFFTDMKSPWNMPPEMWVGDEKLYHPTLWRESSLLCGSNIVETYDSICASFDALLASKGFEREGGLYRIAENAEDNTDTIAIFCHYGLSTAIISHVLGLSLIAVWNSVFLPPSSVTTLFMERHRKAEMTAHGIFVGIGDTSHLFAQGEPISCSGLHTRVLK